MSSTEPLHIEPALPPQNGDQPVDAVSKTNEKPVEESSDVTAEPTAAMATSTTALEGDAVKSAPIDEMLPDQDDKLDEFARLELELAELNKSTSMLDAEDVNNVSDAAKASASASSGRTVTQDEHTESSMQNEMSAIENEMLLAADAAASSQNGQTGGVSSADLLPSSNDLACTDAYDDHRDLIAVLKGESTDEKPKQQVIQSELPSSSKASYEHLIPDQEEIVGVTIEGEGEYQIMEVVDDFEDDLETNVIGATTQLNAEQPATTSTTKSPTSQKLTKEEERAVAMEQIAGLKRPPRRRKQDIKPLPFETSELVSTLGADWSDDGDDTEPSSVPASRPSTSKGASVSGAKTQNVNLKKGNAVADVGAQSTQPTNAADNAAEVKSGAAKAGARKRRRSTGANVTSVIVLPSQAETASDRAVVDSPITAATGFKRTRTIKRRIIWDPDAPETAISYADLVRSKSKDRQNSMSPSLAQKSRSATPKEKQPAAAEVATTDKKPAKRATTPAMKSKADNSHDAKPTGKQTTQRSQTASPVPNGGTGGAITHAEPRKKKISEIDRLMGDEGAASMLSSLESGRGKLTDVSDDDKPHKPLMRSRAAPAEKANKRETTPVAQATPPIKKPRAPKAKPSAAWDYVYQKKQEVSDDSMIIRRRSNSSYSSNASQHRLSIDGPDGRSTSSSSKAKAKSSKATSEDDEDDEESEAATAEHTTNKSSTKAKAAAAKTNSSSPPSSAKSSGNKHTTTLPIDDDTKSFEFLKPKETKKNTTPAAQTKAANRRSTLESVSNAEGKKVTPKRGRPVANKQKDSPQSPSATAAADSPVTAEFNADSNITVRKTAKVAQLVFSTHASKLNGTFTPELMNQIVDALDTLAHDTSCNVVVLLSNGPDFCRGLDLSSLSAGSSEQRKSAADVLASAAKNLLKTFATFPKPLVAGISGSVIGFGVTCLPLFDVVISSEKATLETPYAKIGQVPEGFCIWQNLWNIRSNAKTRLFWLAEKLTSTEAALAGLLTKLTTTDKVNDDAIAAARKISNMPMDAYRYMKKATIQSRLEVVISGIDDEFEEIIKQWSSVECCTKIKKYIESGGHFLLSPK